MNINTGSDRDFVNRYISLDELEKRKLYPQFFESIRFERFRNLRDVTLTFTSPIMVVSGTNRSGKTSVLLSIACSHFNFKRRNVNNGRLERNRWGDVMKFTNHDIQDDDWTYYVTFREGDRTVKKRGQRKARTGKWNGVAKKESQIGAPHHTVSNRKQGRMVMLIDMERVIPARHLSKAVYLKARRQNPDTMIAVNERVTEYLSYILEENYNLNEIVTAADSAIYGYNNHYSSYNTATGEDVLTRLLRDIVEVSDYGLVLIDEIEMGLHPKVQRRLMDVIYHESRTYHKQFVVTSHSEAILNAVDCQSRIYLQGDNSGTTRAIPNISVNAALSKMDAISHPLLHLYVEDNLSKDIVNKALSGICQNRPGFNHLIRIIAVGSADKTYRFFKESLRQFESGDNVAYGCACVLDGDQRNAYTDDLLFFHFTSMQPEKALLGFYLQDNPNSSLKYHWQNSNAHCLFQKMVEVGLATSVNDAFEQCWQAAMATKEGQSYFQQLMRFLVDSCVRFSPEL